MKKPLDNLHTVEDYARILKEVADNRTKVLATTAAAHTACFCDDDLHKQRASARHSYADDTFAITPRLVLEALARAEKAWPDVVPSSACQIFTFATVAQERRGSIIVERPKEECYRLNLEHICSAIVDATKFGRKGAFPAYRVGPPPDFETKLDPDDVKYTQERLPLLTGDGFIPAGYRLVLGVRKYRKGLGFIIASQTPTYVTELECQWSLEPQPEVARG